MTPDDSVPVAVGEHGWMWLEGAADTATVGDLVHAARSHGAELCDDAGMVWVDGRPTDPGRTLRAAGVRAGCRLGVGDPPPIQPPVARHDTPVVVAVVAVVAGPCAGDAVALQHGRHLVGCAPGAAVRVMEVAPHAAVVEVRAAPDGAHVRLVHLCGAEPLVDGQPINGSVCWAEGVVVRVGSTGLRWWKVRDGETPVEQSPTQPDGWHIVQRRGRADAGMEPPPMDLGPTMATPTMRPPLVPAVVTSLTASTVAAVTGHAVMALFAVTSLVATGLWWAVVTVRDRVRRRQARRNEAHARTDRVAQLRRHRPELHEVVARAQRRVPGLWERRAGRHDDVWQVVMGRGRARDDDGTWVDDLPVVVSFGRGARVGVGGSGAASLARAMVAQLITQVGPADVRVTVHQPAGVSTFDDVLVTPHARSVAAHHVVVVVDPPPTVSPLALAAAEAALLVVDRTPDDRVAAWCATVVRWDGETPVVPVTVDGEVVAEVAPAGATPSLLHEVVRAVAGCLDPEAGPMVHAAPTVTEVSWRALHDHDLSSNSVLERWQHSPPSCAASLGRGPGGPVAVDLTCDGPHALIAGTTGSGKSELLRTLVLGWAWNTSPEHLQLILIDYKGGAAFDACTRLPHVVGVVTDLDGVLAMRVVTGLRAELTRREHVLRMAGVSDVVQWNRRRGQQGWRPMARLVIVVDELAALVQELPDVVAALVALAQRGRSLGVHLVLATQRPAGVVRDDIRANTELRICLRVADRADAMEVIGDTRPAGFERSQPGRALVRRGAGDVTEVQVADTSAAWQPTGPSVRLIPLGSTPTPEVPKPDGSSTLDTVVTALADAARVAGLRPPDALWCPPMPPVLPGGDDPEVIGMLDDVAHQRWLPLRCDPSGHAVVIGAAGSGVSHTLQRIVASRPHHDIITLGGDVGCASVVQGLLTRLDERGARAGTSKPITVLVDGVGAMRRRWEHELGPAAWQAAAMWDRLLSDGPAVGITVVVGADRVASCGSTLVSVATTRWLHRPLDPVDPGFLGVRLAPDDVRDWPPGRLVDVGTGLTGQVAFSTPSTMCTVRSA